MINLRTRLLVGYAYTMILILIIAGSAAFGFFTISEAIDRILKENIKSVSASVAMLDALEAQNSLVVEAFLTGRASQDEFARADQAFLDAMALAGDNATVTGEEELLKVIQARFDELVKGRNEALSLEPDTKPLELLSTEVFPLILEVRSAASQLLELNHQAITDAEQAARTTALRAAGWLGFLITISLISMAYLARALQQKVLTRLAEHKDVAESLLTGDLSRRFEVGANDELGVVARQLNAALDARDEFQAEMRGRINQQKQLVLGLLEEMEGERLLMGLDGRLIAATMTALDFRAQKDLQQWLINERPLALERFDKTGLAMELATTVEGRPLQARLLAAQSRRPVGWIIHLQSAGPPPT